MNPWHYSFLHLFPACFMPTFQRIQITGAHITLHYWFTLSVSLMLWYYALLRPRPCIGPYKMNLPELSPTVISNVLSTIYAQRGVQENV
ncbi:hypothetical protein DM02DRAFT_298647 [Periconia macrospinosa]|uniref:Uncharacterized protein n=1 Tax=Periconia macrospinosa TaxID=97972 RepID=A0A2V1DW39_9PLEO|nr:hypothetical protein DM02DRAFT_298647 [Periconia macrospinosa]